MAQAEGGPGRAASDRASSEDQVPGSGAPAAEDWQDWLRSRAHATQRALLAQRGTLRLGGDPGHLLERVEAHSPDTLGPMLRGGFSLHRAREALQTIDRFVLGWCFDQAAVVEQGAGNSPAGRDADFEFGLEALVAGIAAVGQQQPPGTLRMRRRAVSIGLRTLLRHVRQSTDILLQHSGLAELERRLLTEIAGGSITRSAELIAISGVDKARVSRAIRKLDEEGLIQRERVRAPFALTPKGRTVADEFASISMPLHGGITAGIDRAELRRFQHTMAGITVGAVRLLDEEEQAATGRSEQGDQSQAKPGAGAPDRLELLIPQLSTLFTYLQRSGAMMIRRVADLANFEWMVLSTIAEAEPLTPATLIAAVERDHSQARRTLRHLIKLGLVDRFPTPGQRSWMLRLTERGRIVARNVEEEGWRRDTILYGAVQPDELELSLAILETLAGNAIVQLEQAKES